MVTEPRFQLTTRDHAVLQALLDDYEGPHGPYSLLLGQKLRACAIAFSDDIGADVVTLGARVAYTVNGAPAGPHRLVQDDAHDLPHDTVSIRTMRGLALIGLCEGAAVTVDLGNGAIEELAIGRVLPEPEAGGATVVSFRPRNAAAPVSGPEDDDPGPRAA